MFFASKGVAQTTTHIRQSIVDTAILIGDFKFVDMDAVGPGGMATSQMQRFIFLLENATDNELSILASNKNANVRAYAFWSLAIRKYKRLRQILESQLSDSTLIYCRFNCTNLSMPINRFYIKVLTPTNSFMHGTTLTEDELKKYNDRIGN